MGNYTAYRAEKQKRHERQLRQYEAQQAEIQRLEELISRFRNKPRKAAFARSRAKMLERMDGICQVQGKDAGADGAYAKTPGG